MCTYLYAAFSLKSGDGGRPVARRSRRHRALAARDPATWPIEEMGHLTAVWNITAALGGSPRFGRMNFPLDPGRPAGERRREARAVQRSGAAALHLPRAARRARPSPTARASTPDFTFTRGDARAAPHADADRLRDGRRVLRHAVGEPAEFVARVGEKEAFCGDRNLQISRKEIDFQGCDPVICSKTALAGVRRHREPGRRRARGEPGLALPPLHRDPRGAARRSRRRTRTSSRRIPRR